jgi:AAA domain-containing protein/bifunctional DNA primase/polymerase-like protein
MVVIDLSGYRKDGPDWMPFMYNRWLAWRHVKVPGGRTKKMPLGVHGGTGSVLDPKTWGSQIQAKECGGDGVGYVLGRVEDEGKYVCGIDLDGCFDGNEVTSDLARQVLEQFSKTYCEASPSEGGLHLIFTVSPADIHALGLTGRVVIKASDDGHDEIALDIDRRYYTVTGNYYEGRRDIWPVTRMQLQWLLSLRSAGVGVGRGRDETGNGYGMRFFMQCYREDKTQEEAYRAIKNNRGRAGEWARRVDARQLDRGWEQAVRSVEEPKDGSGRREAAIYKASEVIPDDPTFIWYPYILEGGMCIVASAGGTGKGLWTCDMAARETRGRRFFGSPDRGQKRKVLWFEMEDDVRMALVPRLIGAGADLNQVEIYEGLDTLERLTRDKIMRENVGLIVMSPLLAYLDIKNPNNVMEMYPALEKLCGRVKGLPTTIIALMHPNKKVDLPSIERILGSVALPAFVRSVIILKPEDEANVRMVHAKHNNTVKGDDLIFEKTNTRGIDDRGQYLKIKWSTAEENIDASKAFDRDKPTDKGTAWGWLQEELGDKERHKRTDVIAAGERRNYTEAAIRKAVEKHRDAIETSGGGFGGEVYWRLR